MRSWLRVAVVTAAATVAAAILVLIPYTSWTPSFLLAVALLVGSIIAFAFLPGPRPAGTSDDATAIWLVGPLSALIFLLLLVSLGACGLALAGLERSSWVADILWLGVLLAGYSALSAATRVVAVAADQTTAASSDSRTSWAAIVRRLSAASGDPSVRGVLDGLADRIRFAANDPAGPKPSQNDSIARHVAQLESSTGQIDTLRHLVRSIESLLSERESSLQATRSRA